MISTVESQKDYHARRKHHHYPRTTTTTVLSTTKSPVSTTTVTAVVEQVEDNQIPEVTRWTTTEPTETWEITTTSSTTISTTPTTTTTTTTPPRKYTHAFPTRTHISPLSISSQRLLSSNLEFTWTRIIRKLAKSGWIYWNLGDDAWTTCVVSNVENVELLWSVWTGRRRGILFAGRTRATKNFRLSNVTKRGTVMADETEVKRKDSKLWIERGGESEKRRTGEGGNTVCQETLYLACLKRVSLYRLLCGSKAEAESPIHKGGRRKEGEFRQSRIFASEKLVEEETIRGNESSERTFRRIREIEN